VRISPGTSTRAALLVVMSVLGLVLVLAGCSGEDEEKPSGDAGSTTTSSAPEEEPGIRTRVEVGEVTGKLGKRPARKVAVDVAGVVDRWLDAAYVVGKYPRSKFGDAYPGFTKGAAALAGRQAALTSNRTISGRVDTVTATRRVVRVDLLAARGEAAGATAHVNLVIKLAGKVKRTDQVRGRLVLTRSKGKWQVFGFDIERGKVKG
jgi:hypothetical protein